jgi:predicted nucleotidyltransferase
MKLKAQCTTRSAKWYRGAHIPRRVIRRYARQVAQRFQPDKIILFGSYAYGTPHADSDVDLLVIMPARNQIDQAVRIRCEVPARFPKDLIVRTPANMKWRLAEGDLFHTEIVTKGKVLYEKDDKGMGPKGQPFQHEFSASAKSRAVERCLCFLS